MTFQYLFKSFQQNQEGDSSDITGQIPSWVSGSFYRIGPAIFEQGKEQVEHWFDGYGAIHKFTLQNGKMSYLSKVLQTPNYQADQKAGRIVNGGWGTTNKLGLDIFFREYGTANNNVSLLKLGHRLFSMSDYSTLLELNPANLEVKSRLQFGDEIGDKFYFGAAHPAFDHDGKVYNVLAIPGPQTKYVIYSYESDAGDIKRKVLAEIKSPNMTYTHAISVSQKYVIFIEQPVVFNIFKLLAVNINGRVNHTLKFRPNIATKFHLIDKQTGRVHTIETDPFFFYHFVNTFETGNELFIDLMQYKDYGIEQQFYYPEIKNNGVSYDKLGVFTRYKINLNDFSISQADQFAEHKVEFGQINHRWAGRNQRYTYFTGVNAGSDHTFFNNISKFDHQTGDIKIWSQVDCYPGEGLFICQPDKTEEDAGVFITTVLDDAKGRNFVLILDAQSFEELARVHLPYYFPAPLHASFYPNL